MISYRKQGMICSNRFFPFTSKDVGKGEKPQARQRHPRPYRIWGEGESEGRRGGPPDKPRSRT